MLVILTDGNPDAAQTPVSGNLGSLRTFSWESSGKTTGSSKRSCSGNRLTDEVDVITVHGLAILHCGLRKQTWASTKRHISSESTLRGETTMKTIFAALLMTLALTIFLGHFLPCWTLESRVNSALKNHRFTEALRDAELVYQSQPCLCSTSAKRLIATSVIEAIPSLTADPNPGLLTGSGLSFSVTGMR